MIQSVAKRSGVALALAAFLAAGTTGCASMNRKEKGAVIGAATGAAVGGVVGKAAGSTTKGVIIGAAVGGAAGAIIGHQMDQKAKELETKLPDADVKRVGEGILVTFPSGLLFDFDSYRLRPASRNDLSDLAQNLASDPSTELLIAGHTDSVGTEDYNYTLSERRAQSAADYLMAHGVDGARINIVGLGESEPVASNETPEGRQQNRRVEVAIYASKEYRDKVKQQYGG